MITGAHVILYSKDAMVENITKYAGKFVTVSWREVVLPTPVAAGVAGT